MALKIGATGTAESWQGWWPYGSASVSPFRYAKPRHQRSHHTLIGVNCLNAIIATVLGGGIQVWVAWILQLFPRGSPRPWTPGSSTPFFPCEKGRNIRTQKALPPCILGKDLAGSGLRVFTHRPSISPIIRLTLEITFTVLISADLHYSR